MLGGGHRSQKVHFRMVGGQGIGVGWTGPPSRVNPDPAEPEGRFMLLQQFAN